MAQAELTPRQAQIQALIQEGKSAKEIGKKLKISTNAVYQQIRRMRNGSKPSARKSSGSTSRSRSRTARTSGRKSTRTRSRTVARSSAGASAVSAQSGTTAPSTPATAEGLIREEIAGIQAGLKAQAERVKEAQAEIAAAEKETEALQGDLARREDTLAVLTGKKVASDKPKPRARRTPAKKAGGQSGGKPAAQPASAPQEAAQAPSGSNGDQAAQTPDPAAPATQAEREATADHDGAPTEAPAAA